MNRIEQLEAIAASWIGTPFCENSRVKGAGVSCHFLPAEIYIEAGLLPADIAVPTGPPGWSRNNGDSIMEKWLDSDDGKKHFAPVEILAIQPGDLIGFKAGRCVHHLAILLTQGRIVHCMADVGVRIAPNIPAAWKVRMPRAWRPNTLNT